MLQARDKQARHSHKHTSFCSTCTYSYTITHQQQHPGHRLTDCFLIGFRGDWTDRRTHAHIHAHTHTHTHTHTNVYWEAYRHKHTLPSQWALLCWQWLVFLLWDRHCSVCLALPAAIWVHWCVCASVCISMKLLICVGGGKKNTTWGSYWLGLCTMLIHDAPYFTLSQVCG